MPWNGHLTKSELFPIPGGELANDAAIAWNSPGGPADHGLVPSGSTASYRTYSEQVYWRNYWCSQGLCGNAAVPGFSNHGLGLAVDLAAKWMRRWIDRHGHKYGFAKTEAWSEWWHINYVGGRGAVLAHGHKGYWVKRYSRRLAYLRRPHPRGRYLKRGRRKYTLKTVEAVKLFQRDHGLKQDGRIGGVTAYWINRTYEKQRSRRGRRG